MTKKNVVLSVRDLRTYFKSDEAPVKAVDGVSFDLEKGETFGLVGESGSGKSVTSLSIMQLVPQPPGYFPSGEVLFKDIDLLKARQREIEKLRGNEIAMIFQDPMTSLNPFLTVERQLTEVLEVHKGQTHKSAQMRAIEMLELVGIPAPAKRIKSYPHEFSGGMRQRVMIAMALLCEPKLLIADEPTTALDVTIQAQVLELIGDMKNKFGTAVIMITHDLGVVAGLTDRTAVMYAGKIVEEGTTETIFAYPKHPYTQGLLRSVPRLDEVHPERLTPIPGLPPDLSILPPGCPFAPRCDRTQSKCRQSYPGESIFEGGHRASCWEMEREVRA